MDIQNFINQTSDYLVKFKEMGLQINKYNVKPIFITQVQYDGNGDNNVFLINEELKKFSKKEVTKRPLSSG